MTFAQDLMNYRALGTGALNPWLDLAVLLIAGVLFLLRAIMMHRRSRKLGCWVIEQTPDAV